MSTIDFTADFLPCPDEELPAPDRATWGRLGIAVDGVSVVHAEVQRDEAVPWIEGPLSGLVDWIVESWPALLWELHTPFPKPAMAGESGAVPSLGDAARFWPQAPGTTSRNALGAWQHRHTVGHGCSDLALPSMVLVPDDRAVALVLDEPPASLGPTVNLRLSAPASDPIWVPRDELRAALARLVESSLRHAETTPDAAPWARWVESRWAEQSRSERAEDVRRLWRLGPALSERWAAIERQFGGFVPAVEGVLADSEVSASEKLVNRLGAALRPQRRRGRGRWTEIAPQPGSVALLPYQQGYLWAEAVRRALGIGDSPLSHLDKALGKLGIELRAAPEGAPFRAAVATDGEGRAAILTSREWEESAGVAPLRFAIAAALGRLLSDSGTRDAPFGAAHGPQSRWRATQRAQAFAAELLLPTGGLGSGGDVAALAERFGISYSAARWHMKNRIAQADGPA